MSGVTDKPFLGLRSSTPRISLFNLSQWHASREGGLDNGSTAVFFKVIRRERWGGWSLHCTER